jgi:hypothetical protein
MGRVFWDDGAVGVADPPAYVPCLILPEKALRLPEEDRDGPRHAKHECSDDLGGHHLQDASARRSFLFSKATQDAKTAHSIIEFHLRWVFAIVKAEPLVLEVG